jgi:Protein of unknown function (DUF3102)
LTTISAPGVESIRRADWSDYPARPLDRRDRRNLSAEEQEERTAVVSAMMVDGLPVRIIATKTGLSRGCVEKEIARIKAEEAPAPDSTAKEVAATGCWVIAEDGKTDTSYWRGEDFGYAKGWGWGPLAMAATWPTVTEAEKSYYRARGHALRLGLSIPDTHRFVQLTSEQAAVVRGEAPATDTTGTGTVVPEPAQPVAVEAPEPPVPDVPAVTGEPSTAPPVITEPDITTEPEEFLVALQEADENELMAYANSFHHLSEAHGHKRTALALLSGKALIAAKELVPHGDWTDWRDEHFEGSQQTASIYGRLAANYQSISNLVDADGNPFPSIQAALAAIPPNPNPNRKGDTRSPEHRAASAAINTLSTNLKLLEPEIQQSMIEDLREVIPDYRDMEPRVVVAGAVNEIYAEWSELNEDDKSATLADIRALGPTLVVDEVPLPADIAESDLATGVMLIGKLPPTPEVAIALTDAITKLYGSWNKFMQANGKRS